MREVYPQEPVKLVENSPVIEELSKEGIEVVSLDPFVVYVRQDVADKFPNEQALRSYVMKKLGQIY